MSCKIKILFVSPSLRSGGAERQLFELASQLLVKGFGVAVATVGGGNDVYSDRLIKLGANCTRLKNRSKLGQLKELNDLVKQESPDILHGFMNIGCMLAMPISLLSSVPLVSSAIRDARNQSWKYEICYFLLSRYSNYFISNSNAGFNCRYKSWRSNFRVIYNGMNFSRFVVDENAKVSSDHYTLIMVASLSLHKDHETLFKALANPVLNDFALTLQLIGDEPPTECGNKSRLEAIAKKLGISSRVSFLGYQSDVESFIKLADISILLTNSRHHMEGLSNTIAESMALAKPVIATDSGGTPELVEDGVTGLLVMDRDSEAVAKAIKAILLNREFAKTLGKNGRAKILSGFSVERMAGDYIELYEKLTLTQSK